MFAPNWHTCRFGIPTVASDWTFKIDGLAGTCRTERDLVEVPLQRYLLSDVIR